MKLHVQCTYVVHSPYYVNHQTLIEMCHVWGLGSHDSIDFAYGKIPAEIILLNYCSSYGTGSASRVTGSAPTELDLRN